MQNHAKHLKGLNKFLMSIVVFVGSRGSKKILIQKKKELKVMIKNIKLNVMRSLKDMVLKPVV